MLHYATNASGYIVTECSVMNMKFLSSFTSPNSPTNSKQRMLFDWRSALDYEAYNYMLKRSKHLVYFC